LKKILLLSMPVGALERQALGLSLFKARLATEGVPCDVRYLTFTFADLIGVEEYCWLSTDIPHTAFAGEWVFTPSLYGASSRAQTSFVREVLQGLWRLDGRSLERILRAQAMAPHFIDHCLQTVRWHDYAIVGFTSTFEQNIASLALAQRVKAKYPGVKIVFGGANWEGEMGLELHRCFPFVDYAFSGEADESFPKLVRLVLSGRLTSKACAAIPGLIRRSHGESVLTRLPEPVQNLDSLPIPDYSDYFRDFDHASANSLVVPTLLFEGARGCWWGAKRHCMFCGLNGATLKFRAKTPQRALQEIEHLVQRWQTDLVQAVDNVVPMQYFRDFFPALARAERPARMFYEIRANLSREQVKALREARVLHVQPGIESFSNHVLELMRKGTTALQNIQVLKWCKEYGVQADYNLLYGFPGERDEDYQHLFGLLRAIRFLNPPTACGPIRLDRFSPYYREAQTHGFQNVKPMLPYKYLYPFGEESVRKIAYYFDYDLAPGVHTPDRSVELVRWVEDWKTNPEPGTLQAFERPDGTLALLDTRSHSLRSSVVLQGMDKAVYDYCDRVRPLASICDHLARSFPQARLSEDAVRSFLDALVAHGYMLGDDSGYLSLALRSQPAGAAPDGALQERMLAQVSRA
jgi:ribosomal peptide maturation radical SAM protein 1